MVELYLASLLITAAYYVCLAVLIFVSRRGQAVATAWSAVCTLVAAFWLSMYLATAWANSPTSALAWAKVVFTSAVLLAVVFLRFALLLLNLHRTARWAIWLSAGIAGLLGILFWTTPLMVKEVARTPYGLNFPVPGPLMPVHGLYVLSTGMVVLVLLTRAYLRNVGRMRLQLGYILVALAVVSVAALSTLAPTIAPNSVLALIPSLLMIVAPALISYAIIRHQLWDIRTVVHKTVLWGTASLLILVPAYVMLRDGPDYFGHSSGGQLAGALILSGIFFLHFRVLQPWIDHLFARGRHNSAEVMNDFSHRVVNLRGVEELELLVRETLERTVYATTVQIHAMADEDPVTMAMPEDVREWLTRYGAVVDLSLIAAQGPQDERATRLLELCQPRGIVVLLPFIDERRLIGLATLGEKRSLQAYTRNDFVLLERICPAITVALANARLYDQLQALTASLDRRVAQRTEELRTANEQLQALDRQKSKFFANITHELRSPLTMILAPLEDLLLRDETDGAVGEDLRAMHRNAVHLLEQINALLDLTKLDAGALRLELSEVHLGQFVERAVRYFAPLARRNQVRLELAPLASDLTFMGDSEKLDLVLGNLLSNALKFTPAGGEVHVRAGADAEHVVIAVRDTGIGIPADQLERVFDRFAQVDGGTTRHYEGAGIGLALVKELVALHDGGIELDSVEGQGSEFRIRLPRGHLPRPATAFAEESTPSPVDQPIVRRRSPAVLLPLPAPESTLQIQARDPAERRPRVFIVEDNADMSSYLARRLGAKYEVECCADGREALQQVTQRAPDLVVSDVMMPELSGHELCRRLKANPTTAQVPIILITAYKSPNRVLEGFQSGADDYLTKPFNVHELLARIDAQLRIAELSRKLAEQEKRGVLNLVAAGLAHEVRNPITGILNIVRLLCGPRSAEAAPTDPQTHDEMLRVVLSAAERVDQLCADLLGVAHPQSKEATAWPLEEAVEAAARLIGYKRGQDIAVERSFAHQTPVFGQTAQLNQVLFNLLDNAVRAAGPEGRVVVATEQQNGTFRLHVRDSGPGIPPGKEHQIFDPFYTTHAREGSSGLGLNICRRIVEEHGGSILARNLPGGRGAEFTVELPLAH